MAVEMTKSAAALINEEDGMATIETLPLIFLFIFLVSYTMGAFGIVHSGIKNSISARSYAFETFRNRSNLVYFRDEAGRDSKQFLKNGNRTHGVVSDKIQGESVFVADERPLRVGIPSSTLKNHRGGASVDMHNNQIFAANAVVTGKRINQRLEVNPVWLMIQYGMCLNVACGD